jgi:hypothetical protein
MEVSLNLMTSRIGDLLCPQPCGLLWSCGFGAQKISAPYLKAFSARRTCLSLPATGNIGSPATCGRPYNNIKS